jgi:arylmalonate decarboxylase
MEKDAIIGLVVPFADDRIPADGPVMYPDARFVAKGVGVRALTPEGYDPAMAAILPAAEALAERGVDAICVMGTSLTFYKGAEVHRRLIEDIRRVTGLPASTMSQAIVDGLRAVGARRIAVATAYNDEVNRRLEGFLGEEGFDVGAIEGFGISEFGGPAGRKSEAEIIDLGSRVLGEARNADGLLVSCGGLRTLGVAKPLEDKHGVPVVSSTPAAFRTAVRLVGNSGQVDGCGRYLGMG